MGKLYVDEGAERIIEAVQRQLGDGASASEAIRYLATQARKYDDLAATRNREKRLVTG